MIGLYLDLSTAHITTDTYDALVDQELESIVSYPKVCEYDTYGVFVYVPEDEDQDIPVDLKNVIDYARANDCQWIQFDRDAEVITKLKQYQ